MGIRIKLNDGREVIIEATFDQFVKAYETASATGTLLRIEQPDGTELAIAPQMVEMVETAPEALATVEEHFAAVAAR